MFGAEAPIWQVVRPALRLPDGENSVKTSIELNQNTVKELATIARKLDIAGWHEMRKADLIEAIRAKRQQQASMSGTKRSSSKSRAAESSRASKKEVPLQSTSTKKSDKSTDSKSKSRSAKSKQSLQTAIDVAEPLVSQKPTVKDQNPKIGELQDKLSKVREICGIYDDRGAPNRDRFVLIVRDPYWLHVYWELCARLIERAKAAMGYAWHTSVPILRLFRIVADGMNNPRRDIIRDIRIHSGVNNWYVDVSDPPGTFQIEIGFLSREGNFFPIASSNIVQTPQSQVVSGTAKLDGHWDSVAEDFDRIYKLSGGNETGAGQLKTVFEEQLQRSMSLPLISRFGARSINYERTKRHFDFAVNADVVLHGQTDPSVQVSIRGEPIRVANDGSFMVRFNLDERRQVYPIEARGSDGIETQQVIIAIDRNTKTLETVFLDNDEED